MSDFDANADYADLGWTMSPARSPNAERNQDPTRRLNISSPNLFQDGSRPEVPIVIDLESPPPPPATDETASSSLPSRSPFEQRLAQKLRCLREQAWSKFYDEDEDVFFQTKTHVEGNELPHQNRVHEDENDDLRAKDNRQEHNRVHGRDIVISDGEGQLNEDKGQHENHTSDRHLPVDDIKRVEDRTAPVSATSSPKWSETWKIHDSPSPARELRRTKLADKRAIHARRTSTSKKSAHLTEKAANAQQQAVQKRLIDQRFMESQSSEHLAFRHSPPRMATAATRNRDTVSKQASPRPSPQQPLQLSLHPSLHPSLRQSLQLQPPPQYPQHPQPENFQRPEAQHPQHVQLPQSLQFPPPAQPAQFLQSFQHAQPPQPPPTLDNEDREDYRFLLACVRHVKGRFQPDYDAVAQDLGMRGSGQAMVARLRALRKRISIEGPGLRKCLRPGSAAAFVPATATMAAGEGVLTSTAPPARATQNMAVPPSPEISGSSARGGWPQENGEKEPTRPGNNRGVYKDAWRG